MSGVNPVRGEATLAIAGNTYLLAVTMESLAQLSNSVGDPPFPELFRRLNGSSLFTLRAALALFVQSGTDADGKEMKAGPASAALIRDFVLGDLAAAQAVMQTLLAAFMRADDSGGDDAGKAPAGSA